MHFSLSKCHNEHRPDHQTKELKQILDTQCLSRHRRKITFLKVGTDSVNFCIRSMELYVVHDYSNSGL